MELNNDEILQLKITVQVDKSKIIKTNPDNVVMDIRSFKTVQNLGKIDKLKQFLWI